MQTPFITLIENTWLPGMDHGWGNGYVSITKDHKFYGLSYMDDKLQEIDVHGGLTYSEQEGDYWTFGFDTSHYSDTAENWTKDRVRDEAIKLLQQLTGQRQELTTNEAEPKKPTKFYYFSQNNSGGSFHMDDLAGIGECVIIEATSAKHANSRAEEIGLYFNGCESGQDCSCCGDRWDAAYSDEGDEVPSIYGSPIEEKEAGMFREKVYVHYLNGSFKRHDFKTN